MKKHYKIILVSIGFILLFIVGLSFEKLILESGRNGLQTPIVPQDNPAVQYNAEKSKQLHEVFTSRPALTENDKAARQKLTQKKNPLVEADLFTIEYLSAPDEFMVEIRTADIERAKAGTMEWLQDQGLTPDGICKLPVVFYLNYDVAQSLRGTNTEFNPLPPGC
jgi:hypothetical protein